MPSATNADVIAVLNKALGGELPAINQYMLHSRMLEHWGYAKLAAEVRAFAMTEMHHADSLMDRILHLGGAPSMDAVEQLHIGKDVPGVLAGDLHLEKDGIDELREGVAVCEEARDYISRDLMRNILADEEKHIDALETHLAVLKDVGLPNFLTLVR